MITIFNPIFLDFNESWWAWGFHFLGRRVKIITLTLLFAVSLHIHFSCCNNTESGSAVGLMLLNLKWFRGYFLFQHFQFLPPSLYIFSAILFGVTDDPPTGRLSLMTVQIFLSNRSLFQYHYQYCPRSHPPVETKCCYIQNEQRKASSYIFNTPYTNLRWHFLQ